MTLRKALRICNSQPGADVIQFRPGLFNGDTIVLNGTSLPAITDDVQIIGPGANLLSISGNDLSRILQIDASAGHTNPPEPGTVNVTVSGLTFTHGKTPDGIFDPAHNGAAIENR